MDLARAWLVSEDASILTVILAYQLTGHTTDANPLINLETVA